MIEYSPKNIRMWSMLGEAGTAGYVLNELANSNPILSVLTADLCFYSGLERFKTNYPERFYNLGIAEQNMVAVGAAMAKENMDVFATTYASFAASRALDQVRVNMGYMQLPLKILGLAGGLTGGILGATHMGCEDLAIMRSIPNLMVVVPADCTETAKVIESIEKINKPVYVRLDGGNRTPIVYGKDFDFELGRANCLKSGDDILFLSVGSMVSRALEVSQVLENKGISCGVLDMHTIKPLDEEALNQSLNYKMIITMEEHSVIGGLGGAVAEYVCGIPKRPLLYRVGIEDFYPHAAPYRALMKKCSLQTEQIEKNILNKYREI